MQPTCPVSAAGQSPERASAMDKKTYSLGWKFTGWLLRPVQFSVLLGLISLLICYVFDVYQGQELIWAFVIPAVTCLSLEGLKKLSFFN